MIGGSMRIFSHPSSIIVDNRRYIDAFLAGESVEVELLTGIWTKPTVPGGRWFVALIETGIPKFSSSPVGHKDEASAKMEASRLAREHNGKKFGVFHMVTSCVASKEIWE